MIIGLPPDPGSVMLCAERLIAWLKKKNPAVTGAALVLRPCAAPCWAVSLCYILRAQSIYV
jgi:hypothetical protein